MELSLLAKIYRLDFFLYFWATRVISDNICVIYLAVSIGFLKHRTGSGLTIGSELILS